MTTANKEILKQYLADIPQVADKINQIGQLLNFLLTENQNLNLISRKLVFADIVKDHVYDCLSAVSYFTSYSAITDLGSGGGFPALLLAIVFPDKKVNLVEKSVKKSQFLNKAIQHLELRNAQVYEKTLMQTSEDLDIPCDVITCRAFKSIVEILNFTRKFFHHNVSYLLYKARMETIESELILAAKKFSIQYEIHRVAALLEKERHMVILRKSSDKI
ncbi:MAG: 16S rRNA (guanine(527)-N(7))-methyltransferase RsmG [Spirochaetes bacterium]|nr:16S rRNA (guanine(527)-N(7))-methyltransferase RsmG [Spirochaetota bacterium]